MQTQTIETPTDVLTTPYHPPLFTGLATVSTDELFTTLGVIANLAAHVISMAPPELRQGLAASHLAEVSQLVSRLESQDEEVA